MYTKQSELLDSLFRLVPNITSSNIMSQYSNYTLITWMGKYLNISMNGEVFEVVNGVKVETSTSVLLEELLKSDIK